MAEPMTSRAETMRIGAAQTRPVWLDPEATADRMIEWISLAAEADVDLLAFGETFLSGYPFWVANTGGARFDDPQQKRAYAAYLDAALEIDGPIVARLVEVVRDLGVFVYSGVMERGSGNASGTVFATLLGISPELGVVSAHRKLRPTYEERLVWGSGDGHGLRVHDLGTGWHVGGLNCWENWMPTARYALYGGGENLHVSVWPGAVRNTRDITRFIALEGRVWSLAAGSLLSRADVPSDFALYDMLDEADAWPDYDGGSAIAAPDGSWVVEPVSAEERLVMADASLGVVGEERQNFDVAGHYSRPDVFGFTVDRSRLDAVVFDDD
jgi:nitrilase